MRIFVVERIKLNSYTAYFQLRQCQEQIMELETEKEQLQKRYDKLKSRRGGEF